MYYCAKCGSKIKEGASFCGQCGADLKIAYRYKRRRVTKRKQICGRKILPNRDGQQEKREIQAQSFMEHRPVKTRGSQSSSMHSLNHRLSRWLREWEIRRFTITILFRLKTMIRLKTIPRLACGGILGTSSCLPYRSLVLY